VVRHRKWQHARVHPRSLAVFATALLVASACGGSDDTVPAAANTTTIAAAATDTTATASAAATTVTAAAGSSGITADVLCVHFNEGRGETFTDSDLVYFGYTVSGDEPLAVGAEANVLDGASPTDEPAPPTVFAPGRVSPAFNVFAEDGGTAVTWTVVGPDGTPSTATADPSSPECPFDSTWPPGLEAEVRIEITSRPLPEGSAEPTEVEFTATVVGIPETSRCPTGLDPLPLEVYFGQPGGPRSEGTVAVSANPIVDAKNAATQATYRTSTAEFVANIIDVCTGAGATSKTRAIGPWVATGTVLASSCEVVDESGALSTPDFPGECPSLPATGGVRSRGN
jgi:hypothetical protein